jgi:hypothetical protein
MAAKREQTEPTTKATPPSKRVRSNLLRETNRSIKKAIEEKRLDAELDAAGIETVRSIARVLDENYSDPKWKGYGDSLTSSYWRALNDLHLSPASRKAGGGNMEVQIASKLDNLRARRAGRTTEAK